MSHGLDTKVRSMASGVNRTVEAVGAINKTENG